MFVVGWMLYHTICLKDLQISVWNFNFQSYHEFKYLSCCHACAPEKWWYPDMASLCQERHLENADEADDILSCKPDIGKWPKLHLGMVGLFGLGHVGPLGWIFWLLSDCFLTAVALRYAHYKDDIVLVSRCTCNPFAGYGAKLDWEIDWCCYVLLLAPWRWLYFILQFPGVVSNLLSLQVQKTKIHMFFIVLSNSKDLVCFCFPIGDALDAPDLLAWFMAWQNSLESGGRWIPMRSMICCTRRSYRPRCLTWFDGFGFWGLNMNIKNIEVKKWEFVALQLWENSMLACI